MAPRYAYFGIGIVFILALLAFVNPGFMGARHTDTVRTTPELSMATSSFSLKSTAFEMGASLPSQYTCDGTQASPPLTIGGAPARTNTFVLIVEDIDVPKQLVPSGVFLHWLLFNIPGSISEITEGALVGVSGANGAGKSGYAGPCPPAQYEPNEHRYVFTLYALDKALALKAGASKDAVVKAMRGHILGETQLIGKYKKK